MVIMFHYLYRFDLGKFPFGERGVQIFFVISGFLITAILMEQKDTVRSRLFLVKNFIIKRSLRIFPIYYILLSVWLVVSLLSGVDWYKGNAIYYFTYTSNMLVYYKGWQNMQFGPLWTLAIEEQFYLIWPCIILFLPKKKEVWLMVLLVLGSLAFKFVFTDEKYARLLISQIDMLGIGALIAYMIKYEYTFIINIVYTLRMPIIIITTTLLITFKYWAVFREAGLVYNICMLALPSTLVIGCYLGFKNFFGFFLNLRFVRYMGKISYGLYLYHMSILVVMDMLSKKITSIYFNNVVMFLISIGLTILVAHLSYILIEKRFIRLKEKFDV